MREHYQAETTDFSLTSFHDKALREGPMPLPELGYLVTHVRCRTSVREVAPFDRSLQSLGRFWAAFGSVDFCGNLVC